MFEVRGLGLAKLILVADSKTSLQQNHPAGSEVAVPVNAGSKYTMAVKRKQCQLKR